VAGDTVRLAAAAAAAGVAGWLVARPLPSLVDLLVGGLVVLATFALLARLMRGEWPWRWC
jgi:hypothetical protein